MIEIAIEFIQLHAYVMPSLTILRLSHLWLGSGGLVKLTWLIAMTVGVGGWVVCTDAMLLAGELLPQQSPPQPDSLPAMSLTEIALCLCVL